jgi:hypothetical protein
MTKAKSTKATETKETAGAKPWRHSRTGAVRYSSTPMGYPWVEGDEPKSKSEPKSDD